jgi:hypothetical protein
MMVMTRCHLLRVMKVSRGGKREGHQRLEAILFTTDQSDLSHKYFTKASVIISAMDRPQAMLSLDDVGVEAIGSLTCLLIMGNPKG